MNLRQYLSASLFLALALVLAGCNLFSSSHSPTEPEPFGPTSAFWSVTFVLDGGAPVDLGTVEVIALDNRTWDGISEDSFDAALQERWERLRRRYGSDSAVFHSTMGILDGTLLEYVGQGRGHSRRTKDGIVIIRADSAEAYADEVQSFVESSRGIDF